jgi:RHS repeat-associated protein
MHEHLPEFNLINMNGRMYDPLAGMFLSPDPYIQAPGNWLNYNRYSYCLNNPTKYTDPTGELAWFYWLGAALAGGITNLVSNWKNVEGVWDFISTFGIGAGAAVGVLATGGSGAGVMIGTAAVGGAAVGANNSVVAQTGKNFEGFSNVDWSQVGVQAAVGGVAGAAGAAAGYGVLKTDFLVNGVSSPILRSAVVSPIAAGAGHVVGGTTANLFAGQNLGDAFFNSFDGIGTSMAIGGAIGVTATTAMSLASGVNPINGNKLNTSNHAQQRILERNVSRSDINDALKNPLKVTEVQHRENGPSVKYIGNKVTVVVNPETGNIITVIPTGTKVALKLGGTR